MRIGLMLLAMLWVASAHSGWVKYIGRGTHDSYIDLKTIHKAGDLRRGWKLDDFKQRGPQGELSRRTLWELDCKGRRYRALAGYAYAGQMAQGKTVAQSDTPEGWTTITSGTLAEQAYRVVCVR